ncbi:MAG: hypothetical protein WEC15_05730 [Flavobacteriales bacterium]
MGGSVFAFDSFDGDGGISLAQLGQLVFPSSGQAMWFSIALFLLFLIPIIGLLTAGLQLMLGLRAPGWVAWVLAPVWVVSLVVVTVIGIRVGRDFQRSETLSTVRTLDPVAGQVLYLTNADTNEDIQQWSVHFGKGEMDWDLDGLRATKDSVHGGWAKLDIRRSPDAEYHVRIERNSQGANLKSSRRRSENIAHSMQQQDSSLVVSPWLRFPKEDKLRAQRLRYVVLVPVGKAVYLDPGLDFMLDDVKNVTNTLDSDMLGRTWTMTPNGLSSTVSPEDVPDDLIPAKQTVPSTTGTISQRSTNKPEQEVVVRTMVLPDLLTVLGRRF